MTGPAGTTAINYAIRFTQPRPASTDFDNAFRADRDWADVISDGRRPVDFFSQPLPDVLPPAGIQSETVTATGIVTVPYNPPSGAGGDLTVSAHPLLDVGHGAVVIRFAYPDGFVAASVDGDLGSNPTVEGVWSAFLSGPGTAVHRAFWPLDNLWKVTADHVNSGLQDAAYAFREAINDRYGWYAPATVPHTEGGRTAAGVLNTMTALGFTSWIDGSLMFAQGVVQDDLLGARDGGFDLLDDNDREWVTAAASKEWAYVHTDWWADVRALRDTGWTLGAMTLLHPFMVMEQVSKLLNADNDSAVSYADDRPWRDAVRLDDWLAVTGSPQMASACLEAGLTLSETTQMVAAGQTLDLASLQMLAVLRGDTAAAD